MAKIENNSPKTEGNQENFERVGGNNKENDTIITRVKRYLNNTYDFRYNEVRLVSEFKLKNEVEYKDFDSFDENDIYVYLREEGYKVSQTDLKAILRSRTFAPHYPPTTLIL